MKIRKFSLGHSFHLMVLVLLLGIFSPLGCAHGPKQMFSKVWGPDRVTFKEAVGLGDSPRRTKSNKKLAFKQSHKNQKSTKLARNERKTFGQKIGGAFGKVLFAGFGRADKEEKSSIKRDGRKTKSKTLTADARKSPTSRKSDEYPFKKSSEQSRSADAVVQNNELQKPDFESKPAESLYAAGQPHESSSSETNPFAEFLEKKNREQSGGVEQTAGNDTGAETLAQAENPFSQLDSRETSETNSGSTEEAGGNQFVTEFDESWDQIRRERDQFVDDDDDDELDELDELDENDEMESIPVIAFSESQKIEQEQDAELTRREQSRKRVDRLMTDARLELAAGRNNEALNVASYAEKLATSEGVFFDPEEEHPGDLVRTIREKMNNNTPRVEDYVPTNPFALSQSTPYENRIPTLNEERTKAVVKTNPFIRSGNPQPGFEELPNPPKETVDAYQLEIIPAQTGSPSDNIEELYEVPTAPAVAELQTEIIEISDPYGGMVVDSDTVPERIPTQIENLASDTVRRSPIRSADARGTKYRIPKIVPPSTRDRHRSWTPVPAATKSNGDTTKRSSQQQLEPNRGSSLEGKRKRVNSNRGARIIRTEFKSPVVPANEWISVDSNQPSHVEPATLNVIEPNRMVKPTSSDSSSEETPLTKNEQFFQMGGKTGNEVQGSLSLSEWDNEPELKTGSEVAVLQERFVIIVCIAAACLIGFGIRRRLSLRFLRQKFTSR